MLVMQLELDDEQFFATRMVMPGKLKSGANRTSLTSSDVGAVEARQHQGLLAETVLLGCPT